jgi:hypothetical protein
MDFSYLNYYFHFWKVQYLQETSINQNWHLLRLNRHGSHVKLKVIEQAHEFELNMVSLLFNTSHALQPF